MISHFLGLVFMIPINTAVFLRAVVMVVCRILCIIIGYIFCDLDHRILGFAYTMV